jgi:hypothetical protein
VDSDVAAASEVQDPDATGPSSTSANQVTRRRHFVVTRFDRMHHRYDTTRSAHSTLSRRSQAEQSRGAGITRWLVH